jgi:glutamate racemase
VVLACTHYPLLIDAFERLAPWPVAFVDPAPAIARRVLSVLEERGFPRVSEPSRTPVGEAVFTSGRALEPALSAVLRGRGLQAGRSGSLPFAD